MNRRTFLAAGGAALNASRVAGANDNIRLALLGCGGRGSYLTSLIYKDDGISFVAACDVVESRRLEAVQKFGPKTSKAVLDYREVLDRKDVDAVVIGSTDHWHVPMTLDAVAAGKDVYVEKPVTHSLEEGPRLLAGVEASKQIVATGTQQRSYAHFQQAREMVKSGGIGTLLAIDTYWQSTPWALGPDDYKLEKSQLDWDRYLGSAPKQEFNPLKVTRWRSFWDFGGGGFDDFLTHWIDVVQWFRDEATPLSVMATGYRVPDSKFEVFDTMNALIEYPGGLQVTYSGTTSASRSEAGLFFRGSEGNLKLTREGFAVYRPTKQNRTEQWQKEPEPESVVNSPGDATVLNLRNWTRCVRQRKTPDASIRVGIAAARTSHLCNEAVLKQATFRFREKEG